MFETMLEQILAGVAVGIVGALITAHLALRRFRAERWWEKKADSYAKVIEALHSFKVWTDEYLRAEFDNTDLPEEKEKELTARAHAAHKEIQKATDVGSFLLCRKAVDRLKLYEKETDDLLSKQETASSYLKLDLAATENCLRDLIEIAKEDLKTS